MSIRLESWARQHCPSSTSIKPFMTGHPLWLMVLRKQLGKGSPKKTNLKTSDGVAVLNIHAIQLNVLKCLWFSSHSSYFLLGNTLCLASDGNLSTIGGIKVSRYGSSVYPSCYPHLCGKSDFIYIISPSASFIGPK